MRKYIIARNDSAVEFTGRQIDAINMAIDLANRHRTQCRVYAQSRHNASEYSCIAAPIWTETD